MFSNQSDIAQPLLRSSAIRQALILFVVFAIITTVAWLGTYWFVIRDTNRLVEIRLERLIEDIAAANDKGAPLPEPGPGQHWAQWQPNGETQGALPADLSITGKNTGYYRLESSIDSSQTDYVVLIREAGGSKMVAAENVESLEEATDIFLAGLQIALFSSLMATFFAGLWIARRNQTRLDKISHALALVSKGQLDSRINLTGPEDDITLLAKRIDTTTTRLETTMTQMRVQTANIAHDLRTPLARLRALLEERHTALIEHKVPVREEVLGVALDQIDQIVSTFNALLRIAHIESGERKSSFVPIALNELLNNVKETFEPVIEDQGQTLTVKKIQPARIMGDPDMLIQLLGNLIQNALRHGSREQKICLVAEKSQISVTDQGPGIPFDERERVLLPLYQRENQRQGEGHGLGLALVNAICILHDAELSLTNRRDQTGLIATVQFPPINHQR